MTIRILIFMAKLRGLFGPIQIVGIAADMRYADLRTDTLPPFMPRMCRRRTGRVA
jgi:hypothetical protein